MLGFLFGEDMLATPLLPGRFKDSLDTTEVFTPEIVQELIPGIDLQGWPTHAKEIVKLRLLRAVTDWGSGPRYNEEYRKIRWPGRTTAAERQHKPGWLNALRWAIRNKSDRENALKLRADHHANRKKQGLVSYDYVRSINAGKTFTMEGLRHDLCFCIQNNIPFKSKSLEYVPSEFSLYYNGAARVKIMVISPYSGQIYSISYGGMYDKKITYIFRTLFRLAIKIVNKKPTLNIKYRGNFGVESFVFDDLTDCYYFKDGGAVEHLRQVGLATRLSAGYVSPLIDFHLSEMIVDPLASNGREGPVNFSNPY